MTRPLPVFHHSAPAGSGGCARRSAESNQFNPAFPIVVENTHIFPMSTCHIPPKDKRALIRNVGEELVKRHGKRKYYNPGDVRRAGEARGYDVDILCWAYCIYTSPADFKTLHDALGEVCDYVKMKSEVLSDLAGGSFDWPDINLSWLEWPDIDISNIFD